MSERSSKLESVSVSTETWSVMSSEDAVREGNGGAGIEGTLDVFLEGTFELLAYVIFFVLPPMFSG